MDDGNGWREGGVREIRTDGGHRKQLNNTQLYTKKQNSWKHDSQINYLIWIILTVIILVYHTSLNLDNEILKEKRILYLMRTVDFVAGKFVQTL